MDESKPETHGPQHHSYRLKPLIVILIGLVGGAGLYCGLMAWYFTGVDPGGGPSGPKGSADLLSADRGTVLYVPWSPRGADGATKPPETDVLEIVPLSELHVKFVSGVPESVETPKDSRLTATLEGAGVKISAAKEAKIGPHKVTVRDANGKQMTLNVRVKQ